MGLFFLLLKKNFFVSLRPPLNKNPFGLFLPDGQHMFTLNFYRAILKVFML